MSFFRLNNKNFICGLFLIGIALLFGGIALKNYTLGELGNPGPGLFPLIVSVILLLIGLANIVRSYFIQQEPINFGFKNITLVLVSLCGFILLSQWVNMIAGTAFLVFFSSFAAISQSWKRSLTITIVLILIGIIFQKLLGLNLPLY